MGVTVRYKASSAGATELLNCPQMLTAIGGIVQGAASRANAMSRHGGGYVADVRTGKRRAHGMVKTTDFGSILDNSRHNTLLKALGGGGA